MAIIVHLAAFIAGSAHTHAHGGNMRKRLGLTTPATAGRGAKVTTTPQTSNRAAKLQSRGSAGMAAYPPKKAKLAQQKMEGAGKWKSCQWAMGNWAMMDSMHMQCP